ncbi:MAG: efflux RND transporter periplasmic adaptor subunit [Deltaproteobacteria bacterium]|nr:efflux RND transporter periplasmic adaptor subunit [Deltaproteobacteria bacterium]
MRCKNGCYASLLILMLCLSPFLSKDSDAREMPPPVVTVMVVADQQVNPAETYVGRMEAVQAVDLRARVQGYLEAVKFKEGAMVRAGDILYVIEQAPYKADLAEESAKVDEARASLKDAQQYLKRLKTVQSGGVSATDVETATNKELRAKAILEEAKANFEQARIKLGYTIIKAPIDGQIGRTTFTKGNLVGPESGSLARIVQLDPIRVVYAISENQMERLDPNSDTAKTSAVKKCPPVFMIQMPGGAVYPTEGYLDFIDNQVDPNTGTIAVRAIFENPNGFLLPGAYVTVLVKCKSGRSIPVVPQSAVQIDQKGRYVFVVDDENRVQERRIETGAAIDADWVVTSGLSAGERVVVQGVQKVTPGQIVKTVTRPGEAGK